MTKLYQKVLSILCVIALLVSGIAMAFADEANEAPVTDEAAQQTSDDEAARIAAEEEAARKAAEEEAARKAAEEEAARKAAEEEAARKAAEEEAARKAAEEEAARKAAEEEAARKAAEEEAARKAAEEEAARKAAEEEAARKAAEEEAARKAAEEEAARKAAEEAEAARIAAEEEAARKAAEEAEAARIAAEEAAKQADEAIEENETDENGYIEIDDSWGYVDPDVISENTPEITDELKGIRNATMNVNEMLTDSLTFGEELVITLKCGDAGSVLLNLYTAGSAISVKLNGKTVAFYADDSDDPSYEMTSYLLENTAGHSYKITLSTNDAASFKLAAVAEQTEVQEVTPGTEVSGAIKNTNEEPAPSEDINNEVIPVTNENNSENAENTENTEVSQTIETTETTENTADTENNNEVTIEPIVPVEPAEPTIQVSVKTYNALKVGYSISDNLLGGQKAKFQVKCGKNNNVKLVLNANPDDLNIQIEGTDTEFVRDAEGNYSVELNNVAFRKFNIILFAKQDLAFSLSAEAGEQAAVESKEETEEDNSEEDINKEETENTDETVADEITEEVTEETAEGENAEDTEPSEEEAEGTEEEAVEENTNEENEKMTTLGCTKVVVTAEEGADLYAEASKESEAVGHLDAGTEVWVTLNEDQTFGQIYSEDEEAAAQFISMEDAEVKAAEETEKTEEATPNAEEMQEKGCTKVTVTAEEGADLYAEASKESEVVGHLDAGTEVWVTLTEDQTFGQIYSEDEEAAAQFISMEDAEVVVVEKTEETEALTDEQMIELGYRKVQVENVNGADIYDNTSDDATVIGHIDTDVEIWIKDSEAEGWAEIYTKEETKQYIKLADIEKQPLTDEQLIELGYRKVQVLNGNGIDIYDSTEEEAAVIGHADFESELWIKDAEIEGWAEIYTEEESKQFVKIDEITKLTDEQMLEMGYIKVYVALKIGANVYANSFASEGEEPLDHLDVGTELWVKIIEGAERALIYEPDEEASASYINLVDIIAILKPEGMEDLPTRSITVTSDLEEYPEIFYGMRETLTAELENFTEDDEYTIKWQYSTDRGETFIDIEGAEQLSYRYIIDESNSNNIWRILIQLVSNEETLSADLV